MSDFGSPSSAIRTNGFHHVAMRVRDYDRTVQFYCRGLGFTQVRELKSNGTRTSLLDVGGGAYLEIFERKPTSSLLGNESITTTDPGAALLHFAVRTGNCDATLELARRAGGDVTMEPKDIETPGNPVSRARIAFFKGPDGETVELFEERPGA